jgi:hypothetical protein
MYPLNSTVSIAGSFSPYLFIVWIQFESLDWSTLNCCAPGRSDIVSNQFRICPRQSLHLIKVKRFDTEFNFENRCFVFLDSKWHSTQDIVLDNAFKTTSPTFVYRHTGVQWTYCQYKDIHPPVECFSSRIKIRQQWNDRKISIQWSVGNRNPKNEISTFGSFLSMRKKPDSGWNSFHYYLPFNLVNLTADESIDAPFNPAEIHVRK